MHVRVSSEQSGDARIVRAEGELDLHTAPTLQAEVDAALEHNPPLIVIDLTKDVRDGRLRSLDDVAKKAGEKTFIPAAMTVFAYSRLLETQKKEAKALAESRGKP